MSEERKTELLRNFVGWFLDHQTSDEGLFRDLHVEIGMTKKELHDYGIDIDKQFEQAEKEHEKEVDEATDMITAEDIVEQAVYMANAPECCIENTDLGNAHRFAMHMDGTSENEQEWLGDTGEIKMKM